jgi:uncharacterized protein (DUF924 family)
MTMENYETVLRFWFGDDGADDAQIAQRQAKLWWSKTPEIDEGMRRNFEPLVQQAAGGALDAWQATPTGRLALILLTDQFPRNIYRDTPQAFAFDAQARALCREGLASGADRALRAIERVFFYLPLEHSEAPADQERAVEMFAELSATVPAAHKPAFDGFLDYAQRHRDVIARFGRFPHRNAILGRPSTSEESAFLLQKGSSF